jgi:hypothetical protein
LSALRAVAGVAEAAASGVEAGFDTASPRWPTTCCLATGGLTSAGAGPATVGRRRNGESKAESAGVGLLSTAGVGTAR